MPQRGHQHGPEKPYRLVTGKPQAYDTKARIGAMNDGDESYLPPEDFNMSMGPDQSGNGGFTKPSIPAPHKYNISKPHTTPNGSIGGPLE